MIFAFVIVLIAFVVACLVCWAGYHALNFEVEAMERRAEQNQRAAKRHEEEAEILRQQLEDAESNYRQTEAQLLNANNSLASATANLAAEQHAHKQAERTLSEQLSRAQSAIDTLQGRA